MNLRNSSKFLAGAAAILAFGASVSLAQAKPTSTKRIPISKEGTATGEVVAPRVDTVTVTVYKTDTLRLAGATVYKTDTLRTTVTRYDTTIVSPPIRLPGGLYFGLGGGVSAPNGALYNPNSAGPTAQAQIGWQGVKSMLGLRGDVNWAKPGEDGRFASYQADPDILNFNADARLNLPFMTHLFGATHRFALYGLGGYTHTMFKNLPMRTSENETGTTCGDLRIDGLCYVRGNGSWTHENGWNAGGGASLGWGRTELFLESRVLSFNTTSFPQSRQIPFVLGINWY